MSHCLSLHLNPSYHPWHQTASSHTPFRAEIMIIFMGFHSLLTDAQPFLASLIKIHDSLRFPQKKTQAQSFLIFGVRPSDPCQ